MNTTLNASKTTQFASLAAAVLLTFAMLGSVDHLATSQASAGALAQAATVTPATVKS